MALRSGKQLRHILLTASGKNAACKRRRWTTQSNSDPGYSTTAFPRSHSNSASDAVVRVLTADYRVLTEQRFAPDNE